MRDIYQNEKFAPPTSFENPKQIEIWENLLKTKPADSWSEADLLQLQDLVEVQIQLAEERAKLATEDTILTNPNSGARYPNPRVNIVNGLRRSALRLHQYLRTDPGRSELRTRVKTRRAEEAAKQDQGLIP